LEFISDIVEVDLTRKSEELAKPLEKLGCLITVWL